jgi:hypothetical protein
MSDEERAYEIVQAFSEHVYLTDSRRMRLADLIAAAFATIREECAKVAENRKQTKFSGLHDRQYIDGYLGACYDISEDIRNRTAQPAKAQEGA